MTEKELENSILAVLGKSAINYEFNDDITFCMDECNNYDCFRNRKRAITGRPHSFAYLKNTELCENFKENS